MVLSDCVGAVTGGLSVSRGHVLFDSSADPKQRRPGFCLCDGF